VALGNPDWKAPERAQATPRQDPVGSVTVPAGGTVPSPSPVVGLRFTERMRGFHSPGHVPPEDFTGAEKAGQRAGTLAEFTVTITLANLDRFLTEAAHGGIAQGTLHVAGLTPPEGARVDSGVFNLFTDTGSFYERRMIYLLPFTGLDGQRYLLDGYKEVKDHGSFDVWGATATLYTVIRRGTDKSGPVVSSGIIRLHLPDFMQQLSTFEVIGTTSVQAKKDAFLRFGSMFMGTLWDVFVRPRLE
ncbi:MAG: GMC family oxidoreductase, partial [Archangium sp.]